MFIVGIVVSLVIRKGPRGTQKDYHGQEDNTGYFLNDKLNDGTRKKIGSCAGWTRWL
jgi:hypothetical protein